MSQLENSITLYEKYGGENTIKALVESFYDRVLKDPELAPVFEKVDMGPLKRHQALFISQALGGPKQYDGRDLSEAHRGLAITNGQFDRVSTHLGDAMAGLGVSEEDIATIGSIVSALRGQVVSAEPLASGLPEPEAPALDPPGAAPVEPPAQSAGGTGGGGNLYEKLGGEHTIKTVVDIFYRRVLGDAALAPVFQGVDMGNLKRHQALFISQAWGGPKQYDGRSMSEAHRRLAITGAQFDAVAGHLVGALRELEVGQADIDTIVAVVSPLKDEIVQTLFQRWLRAA